MASVEDVEGAEEESSSSEWTHWEFVDIGASSGRVSTPIFSPLKGDKIDPIGERTSSTGSILKVDMEASQFPEHLDEEKDTVIDLHEEYLKQKLRMREERKRFGHKWHMYQSKYEEPTASVVESSDDEDDSTILEEKRLAKAKADAETAKMDLERKRAAEELETIKKQYFDLVALAGDLKRQLSEEKRARVRAKADAISSASAAAATKVVAKSDWYCTECGAGYPAKFQLCPICDVPKPGFVADKKKSIWSRLTGAGGIKWHDVLAFQSFLGGTLTIGPCETVECGWVLTKEGVDELELRVKLECVGDTDGVVVAEAGNVLSYDLTSDDEQLFVMAHVTAPATTGKYTSLWQLTLCDQPDQRVGPLLKLNIVVKSPFGKKKEGKIKKLMQIYCLKDSDRTRVVEALRRTKWSIESAAEVIARSI